MMRVSLSSILLCCLVATGAPVNAAPPDNYLDTDGCDVMVFVEALPSGAHTGSWLVESVFSGERYTYTYDQTSALLTVAPDGLSFREVIYVAWRLEELHAKGTNRTEVRGSRADLNQIVVPFDFDGEIIRGTR